MGVRRRLRALAQNPEIARVALRGNAVDCPCCGSGFRRFRAYNGPDRVCWRCGSMERDRSLWLYLDRHASMTFEGMRILHVAPEPVLRDRFCSIPAVSYVGGDLTGQFGEQRIDVTALAFDDASFDAIICNHVLEHVPDDRRAMRELARVLKSGGWAILQVPDVAAAVTEEGATSDPGERLRRYGQSDHVRRYGWDYVDRLRDAGFSVEVERPETHLEEGLVERFRLRKFGAVEPIFVCRR